MHITANYGLAQAADEIFNALHPADFACLDTPVLAEKARNCAARLEELGRHASAATQELCLATVAPILGFIGLAQIGPGAWLVPSGAVSLGLCFLGNLWGRVRLARVEASQALMTARLEAIQRHLLNRSDWDPGC